MSVHRVPGRRAGARRERRGARGDPAPHPVRRPLRPPRRRLPGARPRHTRYWTLLPTLLVPAHGLNIVVMLSWCCRRHDVAGEAQLRGCYARGAGRVPGGRGQGAGGHGHEASHRSARPRR